MARPKRVVKTQTWKQTEDSYNASNAASDTVNNTSDNNGIAASEEASNENEKGQEAAAVDAASDTVNTTSDDNAIAASEEPYALSNF